MSLTGIILKQRKCKFNKQKIKLLKIIIYFHSKNNLLKTGPKPEH